jgi:hypothetical protein
MKIHQPFRTYLRTDGHSGQETFKLIGTFLETLVPNAPNISVMIVDAVAEVRTRHFPNTSQNRYRLSRCYAESIGGTGFNFFRQTDFEWFNSQRGRAVAQATRRWLLIA